MIRTRFSIRTMQRRSIPGRRAWRNFPGDLAPILFLLLALASAASDFLSACQGLDQPTPANQTSFFDDEGSSARDRAAGPDQIDPPCLAVEEVGLARARSRCLVRVPQAVGAPQARVGGANPVRAPPLS